MSRKLIRQILVPDLYILVSWAADKSWQQQGLTASLCKQGKKSLILLTGSSVLCHCGSAGKGRQGDAEAQLAAPLSSQAVLTAVLRAAVGQGPLASSSTWVLPVGLYSHRADWSLPHGKAFQDLSLGRKDDLQFILLSAPKSFLYSGTCGAYCCF